MNLDTLTGILALLVVVVAVPINWFVTLLLWRLSRRAPKLRVLRYQVIAAFTLSLIVTMFALIFLNNELEVPPLNREQTMVVSRSATLALSIIPALHWIGLYRRASWSSSSDAEPDPATEDPELIALTPEQPDRIDR